MPSENDRVGTLFPKHVRNKNPKYFGDTTGPIFRQCAGTETWDMMRLVITDDKRQL